MDNGSNEVCCSNFRKVRRSRNRFFHCAQSCFCVIYGVVYIIPKISARSPCPVCRGWLSIPFCLCRVRLTRCYSYSILRSCPCIHRGQVITSWKSCINCLRCKIHTIPSIWSRIIIENVSIIIWICRWCCRACSICIGILPCIFLVVHSSKRSICQNLCNHFILCRCGWNYRIFICRTLRLCLNVLLFCSNYGRYFIFCILIFISKPIILCFYICNNPFSIYFN